MTGQQKTEPPWECVTCGTVYDPSAAVPVGDDTPAPTAKIAGPAGAGDAAPRQTGTCQPTGPAAGGSAGSTNPTGSPAPTTDEIIKALVAMANRAGAAPDLGALRTILREELAIAGHFDVARVGADAIADRVVERVAALVREDTDHG